MPWVSCGLPGEQWALGPRRQTNGNGGVLAATRAGPSAGRGERGSTSRNSSAELDLNWMLEPGHHQATRSNTEEASNAGRRENAEETLSYTEKGDRSPHEKPPLRLRSGRKGVDFWTAVMGGKKETDFMSCCYARSQIRPSA